MKNELEARQDQTPILKKVGAGAVLIVAAALAIWIVVGVIKAIFWTVVGVAIVVAVLWAVKTLVW
jgi:hypothetical protein